MGQQELPPTPFQEPPLVEPVEAGTGEGQGQGGWF